MKANRQPLVAFALIVVGTLIHTTTYAQDYAHDFGAEDLLAENTVEVGESAIRLRETILFYFGEDRIKEESLPLVDRLADALKARPSIERVLISGHTDSIGSRRFNLKLSALRAAAVRQRLVTSGVSPDRLVSRAEGEAAPIVPNTSRINRQINRRVEFILMQTASDRRRRAATVTAVHVHGLANIATLDGTSQLTEKTELTAGTLLEVGDGSFVTLRMPDLSVTIVGPRTRLRVARAGLGDGPGRDFSAKLVSGEVEVRDKTWGRTVIFTPEISTVATGAWFTVQRETDITWIRVLRGNVELLVDGSTTRLSKSQAVAIDTRQSPHSLSHSSLTTAPTPTGGRFEGDQPLGIAAPRRDLVLEIANDPQMLEPTTRLLIRSDEALPNIERRWWRAYHVDTLGVASHPTPVYCPSCPVK